MNTMNQDYYWTREWQEGEREADEDIEAGLVKHFSSVSSLIAELHCGQDDYDAVVQIPNKE